MGLTKETIEKNYGFFKTWLINNVGQESANELIERLNENAIMNGTFATEEKSGLAYDGSLLQTMFNIIRTAKQINTVMSSGNGEADLLVDNTSIEKVVFMSQISKSVIFIDNPLEFERKRGKLYTFADTDSAMKMSERSLFICTASGISFTHNEFEAILALGKEFDNDLQCKLYSSPLAYIVKIATDMVVYKARRFYKTEGLDNA